MSPSPSDGGVVLSPSSSESSLSELSPSESSLSESSSSVGGVTSSSESSPSPVGGFTLSPSVGGFVLSPSVGGLTGLLSITLRLTV